MAEASSDNPIVQRILEGSAPPPIKLAAARGALPLTPEELFQVLYALRDDDADGVRAAVLETVRGFEDQALASLVGTPTLAADALDFFARHSADKPLAAEALIANRATGDETLEFLAGCAVGPALERLVTNQVALIRRPTIIDALLTNPELEADQKRRALEVREEFFVKKELEDKRRQDEEERLAKIREKEEWSQAELEKLAAELSKEAASEQEAGTLIPDVEDKAAGETDEAFKSASQRILAMSVPEKILLAIRGSRTERALLVRDSNRLVATSVAKSPKLTEQEIEFIAGMRNVNDEVLRIIGSRRDVQRNYSITLIMVKNPRVPLPIALNFLSRLQERDLKALAGDRNVTEQLRRTAKQKLQKMKQGK